MTKWVCQGTVGHGALGGNGTPHGGPTSNRDHMACWTARQPYTDLPDFALATPCRCCLLRQPPRLSSSSIQSCHFASHHLATLPIIPPRQAPRTAPHTPATI